MLEQMNGVGHSLLGKLHQSQQCLVRIHPAFCCFGFANEAAAQAADRYRTTSSWPLCPIEEHF